MLQIAVAATLVYVATGAFIALGYRRPLYPAPPPREPSATGAQIVRFAGGAALYAAAPPGAATVVHFHGNGEQLADQATLVTVFRMAGLGFYAVEYPGYGLLEAETATEETLYASAEAALGHLKGPLGVSEDRIVLQGQSLGSGVATEMARRGHGRRLVLLAPFTSMTEMIGRFAPLWPVGILTRDRFDSRAKAPSIDVPVLIVHGDADQLIPIAMAEELARTFPRATLFVVPGAGHNDLFVPRDVHVLGEVTRFCRVAGERK